ncbi:MAG TPA: L-seryl-tRNA(Sec) selenium transferase [Actinomycetota bacterium]|nr:L-seryl-tRNA(Sec) selenium transferase [Actinomycetota bacterium]
MADERRSVPSVDSLLRTPPVRRAGDVFGRPLLKYTLTEELVAVRRRAADGHAAPSPEDIVTSAITLASRIATGITPVINATGVVLHTNLGRAPLPTAAIAAAVQAGGYSDLEIDRGTGRRGKRSRRAEQLLIALTGAEDALVVNNCAAALLLSLAALAKGKQVLVSRGELIEIGGEFRIPDIMRASGARLVEVGTTNRTRIGDYRTAATDRTGALLKVHPSNYRVVGFTASASTKELAALARRREIPLLYDVGSGLLAHGHGMPADEPAVVDALADGADLVMCSGDKLLGGPQAGLVMGRGDLIAKLRKHPIARAVRVDKMQIAALEEVLAMVARGQEDDVPVRRMLREPAGSVRKRAQRLSETLGGDLEHAHVHRCESVVGGGSTPGTAVDSWGVHLTVADPVAFAARMRAGSPSAFCRVEDDHVLFDLRTVTAAQVPDLARAIQYALEGDDLIEDDD